MHVFILNDFSAGGHILGEFGLGSTQTMMHVFWKKSWVNTFVVVCEGCLTKYTLNLELSDHDAQKLVFLFFLSC